MRKNMEDHLLNVEFAMALHGNILAERSRNDPTTTDHAGDYHAGNLWSNEKMKPQLIKSTMKLAQLMTWLEGGKSQVKIGDAREFMSKLEKLDLLIQESGHESPLYAMYKKNKKRIMEKGVSKNAKVKLAKMMGKE